MIASVRKEDKHLIDLEDLEKREGQKKRERRRREARREKTRLKEIVDGSDR